MLRHRYVAADASWYHIIRINRASAQNLFSLRGIGGLRIIGKSRAAADALIASRFMFAGAGRAVLRCSLSRYRGGFNMPAYLRFCVFGLDINHEREMIRWSLVVVCSVKTGGVRCGRRRCRKRGRHVIERFAKAAIAGFSLARHIR